MKNPHRLQTGTWRHGLIGDPAGSAPRAIQPPWRYVLLLFVLVFRPAYVSAQTEQNLIFQVSLGMLLAPALGVVAVRWHSVLWARMLTALVLLGTNLMLWSPRFSTRIGEYAGDDLQKTLVILLIVPFVVAIVTGLVLKRMIADRVV